MSHGATQPETHEHHKYCIVGAGPAGVQLGHFLHAAERDYVILERAPRAASFFSKFPIHRTLNSINRQFTRKSDLEYNLRHDWNSLLGAHDTVGLFSNWSQEYWPPADKLVDYINAFAVPQVDANHIRFNTNVHRISTCKAPENKQCRYVLHITSTSCSHPHVNATCSAHGTSMSSNDSLISCSVLVMANGMWKPRQVTNWIDGLNEFAVPYDQLGMFPLDAFKNRSVIIFGLGNAATETADALRNVVRDILIVSRSRPKLMRASRYVGHIRGHRTTLLDAFNFKSYEGYLEMGRGQDNRHAMVPCGPDDVNLGFRDRPPYCIFEKVDSHTILLAPVHEDYSSLLEDAFRAFGKSLFKKPATRIMDGSLRLAKKYDTSFIGPEIKEVLCIRSRSLRGNLTLEQKRVLARLRDTSTEVITSGLEFQKPFDVVITALGWTYDQSLLDESVELRMIRPPNRPDDSLTYPDLTSEFESSSAKHLFVAGAAAHGRDRYRYRASGGFIHGFRFNCRTLWRILEARYESSTPNTSKAGADGRSKYSWDFNREQIKETAVPFNASSLTPLWSKVLNRINTAAGPYEMVGGSLADAVVYDCNEKLAWYIEDLPEDLVHQWYGNKPRLTWSYHFGPTHGVDPTVCHLRSQSFGFLSQFVHPVFQYFPPGVKPKLQQIASNDERHPSSVWALPEMGVSRLHVKDVWLTLDWSDRSITGALDMFRSYIEDAASKFCKGQGGGIVTRGFDERFDPYLYDAEFITQLRDEDENCANPSGQEPAVKRLSCPKCAKFFVEKGGCDILTTGGDPLRYMPDGCSGCVAVAGYACAVRDLSQGKR